MTHTPEPWQFVPWHIEEGPSACRSVALGHLTATTASDADARRIAAAINATAGIPTEALEQGAVRELVEAADNALIALRSAQNFILDRYGSRNPHRDETIAKVEAALAKVQP